MQPQASRVGKFVMQVVSSRAARYGVVGVTGVEPVTLRLSSACSNQLSYTPVHVGGAEETRTPDL
jgi:hypothetical protein